MANGDQAVTSLDAWLENLLGYWFAKNLFFCVCSTLTALVVVAVKCFVRVRQISIDLVLFSRINCASCSVGSEL